jgi:flagellar basal body-associated protein FliL
MIGGDFIKNKKYKSIFFILILFLFVSLLGAAGAADDTHSNMTIQSTGGGDVSPELSNGAGGDLLQASAEDEVLTANTHDFNGTTYDDLRVFLNSQDVQPGDTVYLGKKILQHPVL